jgi:hypothetical protein
MESFYLYQQLCDLRSAERPWDRPRHRAPLRPGLLAIMVEIYIRYN